ncbi:MAG: hypothetical protein CMI95_06400 [Pelagibacteraceae bacterium]|nr:hypothetical protein [Pelagibacteraceae bacterium]
MKKLEKEKIKYFIDLINKQKFNEVIGELKIILSINNNDPSALELLGFAYERSQNYKDSINIYKKLLIFNKNFKIYDRLGLVCLKSGRFKEASEYFQNSLKLNLDNPVAYNNKGLALAYLKKEDDAITNFQKAIAINKKYKEPVYNLLEIFEKINSTKNFQDLTKSSYKKFKNDPIIEFYYARYLEQINNLKDSKKILQNINFKDNKVWNIRKLYFIGEVSNSLGQYPQEFKYFKQANDETIKLVGYNNIKNNKYIKNLKEYMHGKKNIINFRDTQQMTKKNYPKLFFLIGFPRSGTTLIDTILRTYSNVRVIEEKPFVAKMRNEYNLLNKSKNLNKNIISKLSKIYLSEVCKNLQLNDLSNLTIVDKFPLNMVESRFIKKIFPNSKFIFVLRHPLDCVLSGYMQQFVLNDAMLNFLDLNSAAEMYNDVMKLWLSYKEISNASIHTMKYENLIENFEETIRGLLQFMNLKWNNNVTEFNKIALKRDRIRTPSYKQVVKPIYKSSNQKWKNYSKELDVIKPKLESWIKYFNYDL